MVRRMFRAATLEAACYDEMERDAAATPQAAVVVVLASVAAGIGASSYDIEVVAVVSLGMLISWPIWAWLVPWIGTALFRTPAISTTYGARLRAMGLATSPEVLRVVSFLPALHGPAFLIATSWTFVARVIAVRQVLDCTTGQAVATCLVCGLLVGALNLALLLLVYLAV